MRNSNHTSGTWYTAAWGSPLYVTTGRFITRVESPQVAPCWCEVKFVNVFVKKVSRVG